MVCLHHGTGCSHSWLKFARSFAQKGYDVVAFDRLGYGDSPALSTRDLPREFLLDSVQQVVSVLNSLALRNPLCLVGHSDGASIALMTASLHPERVACVVAEAPHMKIGAYESPRLLRGFDEFEKTIGKDPRYQAAMQRYHGSTWRGVESRWKRYWTNQNFHDWDQMPMLDGVVCPVLVVHGESDPFFSLQHSEDIVARLHDGRLICVPKANHSIHQERAREFNHSVCGFLHNHWTKSNFSKL